MKLNCRSVLFMKTFLLTVFSLALITFFTLLTPGVNENGFFKLFVLILTCLAANFILSNVFKTVTASFVESLIPAFIIFIITDYDSQIYLQIFAVILSLFINYFIKHEGREMFNDISLALFTVSFFGLKIDWWGTNTSFLVISLIFIFGVFSVISYKSVLPTVIFFLATFSINIIFTFNLWFAIKQLFVPGFVFFAFYLLVRNKSILASPLKSRLYPLVVSFLAITTPKLGLFTEPLITSLVLTDLGFLVLKKIRILEST